MKHKVLDLFAGIGGFSLGLEATGGFETTAFCELDKKAQLVLKKHWPDTPIYEDIKELTYDRLQADGNVPSVITGGFPCVDISVAGKGKGILAERSGLWSEMFRLIGDVRPTWAIIENVSALRSKGLTLVLQNLCEIGYMCEWHCIPASAVGAPHQRDRIWIVAHPISECPQPIIRETLSRWKDSEAPYTESSSRGAGGDTLFSEFGNEKVADPMQERPSGESERNSRSVGEEGCGEEGAGSEPAVCSEACSSEVADPDSKHVDSVLNGSGQEGSGEVASPWELHSSYESFGFGGDFWKVEPNVGRVAHGVPKRVDRLKQLGNSVVPQIPYLLGCAILSTETLDAEEDTNAHDSN